jgi:hypothetical protein
MLLLGDGWHHFLKTARSTVVKARTLTLYIFFLGLWLLLPGPAQLVAAAKEMTPPEEQLLASAYPAGEVLHYDVTWLGLTAGRLTMAVKQLDDRGELLALEITARTAGLLGKIYPVRDTFRVVVRGPARLPSHYRIDQHQGERRNIRTTIYNQERRLIVYQRNQDPVERFTVAGPVHNEFSAFYAMRIMPLALGKSVVIPTFADRERHDVEVMVEKIESIDSILGRRESLQVRPQLTFVGLYEKAGDPQIWLTDDQYRVPLRVRSRIAIGSLTATLTYYQGPAGEFPSP